jgi:class 3 adenylate cyclase/Tfp pilus assembly protein PilF
LKSNIHTRNHLLVDQLNKEAFDIRHQNRTKARRLSREALKLAMKDNYQNGQGHALLNLGFQELSNSDFNSAFNNFNKALDIFKESEFLDGIAQAYYNLGIVYLRVGDYDLAMKFQQKSLKINMSINNNLNVARCKNQIGFISTQFGLYDIAIKEYNESLALMKELDYKAGIASIYLAMGILFMENKDFSKAKNYMKESLILRTQSNETDAICNSMNYLADVYLKEGNTLEAKKYLEKALSLAGEQKSKFTAGICRLKTNMGKTYADMEDYEKAFKHFNEALTLAIKSNLHYQLPSVYLQLYKMYKSIKEFDKALGYHEKYHESKQKVNSLNATARLKNLQLRSKIQLQEKKVEIHRLKTVELKKRNKIINQERKKSDELILNILPKKIVQELKLKGKAKARLHHNVSVLFIDFVSFTKTTEVYSAEDLVQNLDSYFSAFDEIISRYNLEKIKTIGDAYMAAGGVPVPDKEHAYNAVSAAIAILDYTNKTSNPYFIPRIGIHSGPVIAGIVGKKKYTYDIWGDTVNVASRMESSGEPGKINISGNTRKLIKDQLNCIYRGKIYAKNKGNIDMYFIEKSIPVKQKIENANRN